MSFGLDVILGCIQATRANFAPQFCSAFRTNYFVPLLCLERRTIAHGFGWPFIGTTFGSEVLQPGKFQPSTIMGCLSFIFHLAVRARLRGRAGTLSLPVTGFPHWFHWCSMAAQMIYHNASPYPLPKFLLIPAGLQKANTKSEFYDHAILLPEKGIELRCSVSVW